MAAAAVAAALHSWFAWTTTQQEAGEKVLVTEKLSFFAKVAKKKPKTAGGLQTRLAGWLGGPDDLKAVGLDKDERASREKNSTKHNNSSSDTID